MSFHLSQFHYHGPAENQVNGDTYPMEEHFVNVSATGAETVLGVFLQLGAHNDALDPILNAALAILTSPNTNTTITTPINFAGLLPTSLEGWFYQGSLTTPPLSQVVNWLVFSTPITLDFQQLKEYETVAGDSGFLPNARPIQPLEGRQLNAIDYDVNVQNQSISGLNFSVGPTSSITSATNLGSSNPNPNSATVTSAGIHSAALPVLSGNSQAIQAAAAAQNYMPVAGCNCPLCQMLRNAVWHQVSQSDVVSAVSASTTVPATASSSLSANAL